MADERSLNKAFANSLRRYLEEYLGASKKARSNIAQTVTSYFFDFLRYNLPEDQGLLRKLEVYFSLLNNRSVQGASVSFTTTGMVDEEKLTTEYFGKEYRDVVRTVIKSYLYGAVEGPVRAETGEGLPPLLLDFLTFTLLATHAGKFPQYSSEFLPSSSPPKIPIKRFAEEVALIKLRAVFDPYFKDVEKILKETPEKIPKTAVLLRMLLFAQELNDIDLTEIKDKEAEKVNEVIEQTITNLSEKIYDKLSPLTAVIPEETLKGLAYDLANLEFLLAVTYMLKDPQNWWTEMSKSLLSFERVKQLPELEEERAELWKNEVTPAEAMDKAVLEFLLQQPEWSPRDFAILSNIASRYFEEGFPNFEKDIIAGILEKIYENREMWYTQLSPEERAAITIFLLKEYESPEIRPPILTDIKDYKSFLKKNKVSEAVIHAKLPFLWGVAGLNLPLTREEIEELLAQTLPPQHREELVAIYKYIEEPVLKAEENRKYLRTLLLKDLPRMDYLAYSSDILEAVKELEKLKVVEKESADKIEALEELLKEIFDDINAMAILERRYDKVHPNYLEEHPEYGWIRGRDPGELLVKYRRFLLPDLLEPIEQIPQYNLTPKGTNTVDYLTETYSFVEEIFPRDFERISRIYGTSAGKGTYLVAPREETGRMAPEKLNYAPWSIEEQGLLDRDVRKELWNYLQEISDKAHRFMKSFSAKVVEDVVAEGGERR